MNKMHTLAKMLITIVAVYWLTLMAIQIVIYPLMIAQSSEKLEMLGMAAAYLIVQLVIVVIILQIIYKRNKIADKIVGIEETASPQSQVEWIGFSYRLISLIAGLYCFYRAAGVVSTLLIKILIKTQMVRFGKMAADDQIYSNGLILVILLAAGVYFLCGAPQFVRWQVKKTKEMFVDMSK